jgi:phenylacetate-coenzyme A ligase PaaK-like adenylate-forming protein
MRIAKSVKYRPRYEWAEGLRSRALAEFIGSDLDACLEAFRNHSAFYARRLTGVSRWQDIKPLDKEDFASLPVSTDGQTYDSRSSGTSGFQVTVRNSISERRFRQALAYRPFLFYTLDDIVRQVIFIDGIQVEDANKKQWPFKFGGRTYLTWRVGIAAPAEQILSLLQTVRPHVIRGLSSGIVRFIDEVGTRLDGLGVQVVSPSGEHLTPAWRVLMGEAFATPLLDRYGTTETGPIAWQCPFCGDYHANSDEIILEYSPEGLLATPLFIESQAMLRYRPGDRVVMHTQEHDCRIRLPKLTILQARRDDWIIDGLGRKVSPLSFQFEQVEGLRAWRIHQLKSGVLRLYFDSETSDSKLGLDVRRELASQLQAIVPGREYELVAGIWKLERGGKFKRVVSDIATG